MKSSAKWGLALGGLALVVVGVAVASSAAAAESPDAGKGLAGQSGVRHGIRFEGCSHFELADPDAVEAWVRSNAWKFAGYLLDVDAVRANPEPLMVDAMQMLFPECSWPPPPRSPSTFGPERVGWSEAVAAAKVAAASYAGAAVRSASRIDDETQIARILTFAMRERIRR